MHHHYVNQDTPSTQAPMPDTATLWAGLSPKEQGGVL